MDPPLCTLTIEVPGADRHEIALTEAVTTIGRDPASTIALDQAYVSRQHARIERTPHAHVISDAGSRNGVYLNRVRLEAPHVLSSGDEIGIGEITLRFSDPRQEALEQTIVTPSPRPALIRCEAATRDVWIGGRRAALGLSVQEFDLLSLLCASYGKVRTRDELGEAIWGRGNYEFNMLHRLVHRLKQKLQPHAPDAIESVAGVGYKISEDLADSDGQQSGSRTSTTAVILFADIVDSTAITERIGDTAFRERAAALDRRLRTAITAGGGAAIEGKLLGDGVLAVFSSAAQAINAAVACAAATEGSDLQLHLGLHAGDVIHDDNNVFGGAVNTAARVSSLAAPNEVLASEVVRSLARTSADVLFEDRGEHVLKGIGEPLRIWAVIPRG